MSQAIRTKLKAYDLRLVNKSAREIIRVIKPTEAKVTAPILLRNKKNNQSHLTSIKKSRKQFKTPIRSRLIDIDMPTAAQKAIKHSMPS